MCTSNLMCCAPNVDLFCNPEHPEAVRVKKAMADTQLAYRSLKETHGIDVNLIFRSSHVSWDIDTMQWHAFDQGMPMPACGQSWMEGNHITFGSWNSLMAALDIVMKDEATLGAFCKVFGWDDVDEITCRYTCLLEQEEEEEEEPIPITNPAAEILGRRKYFAAKCTPTPSKKQRKD